MSTADDELTRKHKLSDESPNSPTEIVGQEHAIGELRFIINQDGSVTFTNLPPDMIEVARSLDPDATLACDVGGAPAGESSDS